MTMNRMVLIIMLFFFASCTRKIQKRKIGSTIVEALFINDSIADGIVKYYTEENVLKSLSTVKGGKKNGVTIFFYPDGKVYDSLNYINDLANGKHYRYDSTGKLVYQDFFIDGEKIGETFFYKNGELVKYEFVGQDNILLYESEYNKRNITKVKFKSIINLYSEEITDRGVANKSVRFFWLSPPGIEILYSLGISDTLNHVDKNLSTLSSNFIIKDTVLPVLKYPFCYYISAVYSDTLNKFEKVYIQEF